MNKNKITNLNQYALKEIKKDKISTNLIVKHPKTNCGWAVGALIKDFIAGKFTHDEDVSFKARQYRQEIPNHIKNKIRTLFIHYYIQRPKKDGAIKLMITRDKNNHYPFKQLSHLLTKDYGRFKFNNKNDKYLIEIKKEKKDTILENKEKSFLDNQISDIFGTTIKGKIIFKVGDINKYFREQSSDSIRSLSLSEGPNEQELEELDTLKKIKALTKKELNLFEKFKNSRFY